MNALRLLFLVLTATLLFGGVAWAQEEGPLPKEGAQRHDGFFLRLNPGLSLIAYAATFHFVERGHSNTARHVSPGLGADLSIGGTLRRNLHMHFDFSFFEQPIPQRNFNTVNALDRPRSVLGTYQPGIGMTGYFSPLNLYVSGSLRMLMTRLYLTDRNQSYEKGSGDYNDGHKTAALFYLGAGAVVSFGREWWMSDNWGLGVAAQAHFGLGKMIDWNYGGKLIQGGANLLLCATYN